MPLFRKYGVHGYEELLDLVYEDPRAREALVEDLLENGELDRADAAMISRLAIAANWINAQLIT